MAQTVKNLPAMGDLDWEDLLERGTPTTPVFWPGEFHGLYGPWGHKELDTTEGLSTHTEKIGAGRKEHHILPTAHHFHKD